jgi:hypothetical protein
MATSSRESKNIFTGWQQHLLKSREQHVRTTLNHKKGNAGRVQPPPLNRKRKTAGTAIGVGNMPVLFPLY